MCNPCNIYYVIVVMVTVPANSGSVTSDVNYLSLRDGNPVKEPLAKNSFEVTAELWIGLTSRKMISTTL